MATYVYAIVLPDHPRAERASGVGDPPGDLRRVVAERVAAVVGDAPADLRARRRDVTAHHDVLTGLAAEGGPVLPMRFGMVVEDDAEVERHLAEHGAAYAEALRRLEGKTEFNVKAEFDLDTVLPGLVVADPQIMAQRERSRATGALDEQMRLGEMVEQAVARHEAAVRDFVVGRLEGLAADMKDGPTVRNVAANVSFLVSSADTADFRAAVDALRGDVGEGVELRCTGPLPVYSFVPEAMAGAG
ncbi:GvpL/GvpF family gas vesicle protein [Yinghuangia seranimata]|uniref:GvpL/GvpF family gas vesicle protein n=1 Tax=Yinghuangia seranimata TaxID=408067 RepID=UPI00248BACD7|nr:GvpL/GvpF family gas vesicle protein [Yinghuangia seranimata]MDI2125415.1 GvpL/GvpF family gas vesicle protein [Yinghuangia seranimata]